MLLCGVFEILLERQIVICHERFILVRSEYVGLCQIDVRKVSGSRPLVSTKTNPLESARF